MNCPICQNDNFKCSNSWKTSDGYIKRNRIFRECGHKIKTIELPEHTLNKYIRLVKSLRKV